ncbi:MAG TPA: M20/M25/M40 family metallo-hydrolase [Candidatus Lumbricidophila sp.]|nr:M20/M25/M40 family metallo-hydrolase [Candidatus Lumbricidophila sp.]
MVDPGGAAQRLARMVQIETVSAHYPERGTASVDAFLALLEHEYPRVAAALERERVGEFGVLYRWRGARAEHPLVLMAHFDVVPADEGDGWLVPPFAGHITAHAVHGRGTLDDKGALCVILEAVESLLAEGVTPARDVWVSFGGDEEVSGRGAAAISDALRDRGVEPWLVLDEGGAVVDAPLPFVPARAAMIGIGEKGFATVRLTATSSGGHASAPTGLTAVARIARAVDRVQRRPFSPRLTASARAMFRAFEPQVRPASGRLLLWLVRVAPWLAARLLARQGGDAAALVRTTVAATMLTGGTAANVLPPEASATLNMRLAPGCSVADAIAHLRRAINDREVQIEVVEASEPSPESPVDDRFAALATIATEVFPGVVGAPYLQLSASDARWFHRYCSHVYRFVPFELTAAQRASIHAVDEFVTIDSLARGIEFHRTLIQRLPS